jgi:LysM repeat protein
MTERGLPIVDGAPACPFVAFDDDRDERAASPDHRHRCYAEPKPAPRALAHQEAYCLSSAFPVCPTFQDWARREAARSRADAPRPTDSVAALAAAPQVQRNPPRSWAAPPPWASRGDARGDQEQLWEADPEGEDGDVTADPAIPSRGQGLSGSFADRVASGPGADRGTDAATSAESGEEADAPPPTAPPPAAPRFSAPSPDLDDPRFAPERPSRDDPDRWDVDEGLDDEERVEEQPQAPVRRRRERDLARGAALGGGGRGPGPTDQRPLRRRDPDAPEWERPRPMEAYPTLRSRRLSELSVPPILVGVVALALAAAVLFALPGLLGFGNPSAGGSPTPTLPVNTPLVTPAPTPIPQPTDQIYIVQSGDTMSRIAGRFNIPLEELIAANAENIPNPDQLQIGDQVIIPAQDPDELPTATEIPGAS